MVGKYIKYMEGLRAHAAFEQDIYNNIDCSWYIESLREQLSGKVLSRNRRHSYPVEESVRFLSRTITSTRRCHLRASSVERLFRWCKICHPISYDIHVINLVVSRHSRQTSGADAAFLYVIDYNKGQIITENCALQPNPYIPTQIARFKLNEEIAGYAAVLEEIVFIKDAQSSEYHTKKMDEICGFPVQTVICYPVKDERKHMLAVIEMCFKEGRKELNDSEKLALNNIALFCLVGLRNCSYLKEMEETELRIHLGSELLIVDPENVTADEVFSILSKGVLPTTSYSPDFNSFGFVPRSIGDSKIYVEASLSMFEELGFIEKYRIDIEILTRFMLLVSKGYRDVPYHNWSHAFAVSHFSYLLLRTKSVQEKLTELEQLALLVGSFCHDIDHRGTSNKFQMDLNTRLSRMFQPKGSIMERHHLNQTQLILRKPEFNILSNLSEEEHKEVMQHLDDIIIATDIAIHLKKTERIRKMVSEGFNKELWEHRFLLKGLCMTAADLSDQSKDFHNSKSIAATIYREFFAQGDLEQHVFKALPAVTMDRERADLPQIQLDFLDGIGIPTYKHLAMVIPEIRETYEAICFNRKCWAKLGEILKRDGLTVKDVDYLSNASLEERALKELQEENVVKQN